MKSWLVFVLGAGTAAGWTAHAGAAPSKPAPKPVPKSAPAKAPAKKTTTKSAAKSPAKAAPSKTAAKPPAKPAAARLTAVKPETKPAKAPVAAKPAPEAKPAPAPPAAYVLRGPLDVPMLQRQQRATVAHGKLEAGDPERIFDGNSRTAAYVEAPEGGAAFVQVALRQPTAVEFADVTFVGEGTYSWTLHAADSAADLEAKRGSYFTAGAARTAQAGDMDQVLLPKGKLARVYRLEARRVDGEGPIPVAEWALWTPQELARIEIQAITRDVGVSGKLPLRSVGFFEEGARQNLTPDVQWEVSPPALGHVDAFSRFEGLQPGEAVLTARMGRYRSEPFRVQILADGKPDWDVTYIERQPRLDYRDPQPELKEGQLVYWFAHVKNYGTVSAPPVPFEWRVDGETVQSGHLPALERFGQTEAILSTKWDGKPHTVELVVDPGMGAAETCEGNNALTVRTDAVSVGFWVEERNLEYFHRHQRDLNAGSNSWEDWAQRQIAMWNRKMEEAEKTSLSPAGTATRWRLDRIIVVGDGMLPMSGGSAADSDPGGGDHTVQWTWGFPAYYPDRNPLYRRTAERSEDNPFYFQAALLKAMEQPVMAEKKKIPAGG